MLEENFSVPVQSMLDSHPTNCIGYEAVLLPRASQSDATVLFCAGNLSKCWEHTLQGKQKLDGMCAACFSGAKIPLEGGESGGFLLLKLMYVGGEELSSGLSPLP